MFTYRHIEKVHRQDTSRRKKMTSLELIVKGKKIPLTDFPEKVVHDVVLAVVSTLREVKIDDIKKIEIS